MPKMDTHDDLWRGRADHAAWWRRDLAGVAAARRHMQKTSALNADLLEAMDAQGGLDAAMPKGIQLTMSSRHLTRAHVASHLRKCRNGLRRDGKGWGGCRSGGVVGGGGGGASWTHMTARCLCGTLGAGKDAQTWSATCAW